MRIIYKSCNPTVTKEGGREGRMTKQLHHFNTAQDKLPLASERHGNSFSLLPSSFGQKTLQYTFHLIYMSSSLKMNVWGRGYAPQWRGLSENLKKLPLQITLHFNSSWQS